MSPEDRWIWPFELLERIGRGGMGEVYRARYVKNDRIVAVKLLPPEVTDATILARFEREVGLLKGMRHPNIVLTFGGKTRPEKANGDVGPPKKPGRLFYAMEYLPGGTLQDKLEERGRLSPGAVIQFAREICAGLAFAHEKGVVHRDLKPGNFLLAEDGTVKLADFGLAAVREGSKLTAEGRTLGTFRYMAPEQIRGRPDPVPQTDLYSLGVVLFELLTGRPPFRGNTPAETLQMHLKTPAPRVIAHEPHAPPALDELVSDLLEKRIEDRPASAEAVGERLAEMDPARSGKRRQDPVAVATPPTARRAGPLAEDGTGDTAAAAPTFAPSPARLRWLAAGSLALCALMLPWAAGLIRDGSRLASAEARWIGRLTDGPVPDRVAAAGLLGELGEDGRENFDALVAALEQPDPPVRAAAAESLAHFPTRAGVLRPLLVKLQRNESEDLPRQAAAETVRAFDYPATAARAAPAAPPAGTPWWAWAGSAVLLAVAVWAVLKG